MSVTNNRDYRAVHYPPLHIRRQWTTNKTEDMTASHLRGRSGKTARAFPRQLTRSTTGVLGIHDAGHILGEGNQAHAILCPLPQVNTPEANPQISELEYEHPELELGVVENQIEAARVIRGESACSKSSGSSATFVTSSTSGYVGIDRLAGEVGDLRMLDGGLGSEDLDSEYMDRVGLESETSCESAKRETREYVIIENERGGMGECVNSVEDGKGKIEKEGLGVGGAEVMIVPVQNEVERGRRWFWWFRKAHNM